MSPNLNYLSRFSENVMKSLYKIEKSGNLLKIVRFFLPTISHTCGAIKVPREAVISIDVSKKLSRDKLIVL